jgi:hypothetical protein
MRLKGGMVESCPASLCRSSRLKKTRLSDPFDDKNAKSEDRPWMLDGLCLQGYTLHMVVNPKVFGSGFFMG